MKKAATQEAKHNKKPTAQFKPLITRAKPRHEARKKTHRRKWNHLTKTSGSTQTKRTQC